MVIIVGENAEILRFKARKLFGGIFHEREFVVTENRAAVSGNFRAVNKTKELNFVGDNCRGKRGNSAA